MSASSTETTEAALRDTDATAAAAGPLARQGLGLPVRGRGSKRWLARQDRVAAKGGGGRGMLRRGKGAGKMAKLAGLGQMADAATAADATTAVPADAAAAAATVVPSEDQVDGAKTLVELREQEAAILETTRRHEEALQRLQARYQKVRRKMYRDHKKDVIKSDNAKLARFQGGCAKPKKLAGLTKAEADEQARCLQTERSVVDDSDLGQLMRRHLWTQPTPLPASSCRAFRSVELAALKPLQQECLRKVGDAKWTAEGLVDADADAKAKCGRRWYGTAEARCLLAGHDLLFVGNSVVRRQMYSVLDLLAGPSAHRQLNDFSSVDLRSFKETGRVKRSWIWDQDNATYGYHAAQLFTVDLATGEHRFSMPHHEFCGVEESFACYNAGRMNQWLYPGSGGGSEELKPSWRASKWLKREWRPLVSFQLSWNAKEMAAHDSCAPRQLSWAGAYVDGVAGPPEGVVQQQQSQVTVGRRGRPRPPRASLAAKIRSRVRELLGAHFGGDGSASPDAREWLPNVTVHVEQPLRPHPDAPPLQTPQGPAQYKKTRRVSTDNTRREGHPSQRRRPPVGTGTKRGPISKGRERERERALERPPPLPHTQTPAVAHTRRVAPPCTLRCTPAPLVFPPSSCAAHDRPNVWIYFPTYHGEREDFNGFCEDKACACTGRLAQCHRHPECQTPERSGKGKHVCEKMAPGSAAMVDRAREFATAIQTRGKLLGHEVARVRTTPFYDDCWEHRGRCQGHRPCREPVDAAWTCRATAMMCPKAGPEGWPAVVARAKAWIPRGHPSASLLYLFDGQTSELIDETFRTWGTHTVGYGASAMIFGPQFGNFLGASAWHHSFGLMRSALRRADACVGRRTQLLFRSPGFNFDPVNSPQNQAAFSKSMRPIVEDAGMIYVDNYPSTYDAVFQDTPQAVKFAKNSAFHYLNAGRYLMAQLLLHAMQQLAPVTALPG